MTLSLVFVQPQHINYSSNVVCSLLGVANCVVVVHKKKKIKYIPCSSPCHTHIVHLSRCFKLGVQSVSSTFEHKIPTVPSFCFMRISASSFFPSPYLTTRVFSVYKLHISSLPDLNIQKREKRLGADLQVWPPSAT